MIDKHFFADADTPFHVWVRESCGAQGFRWVLRHASQVMGASSSETASSYNGARGLPTLGSGSRA